MSRCFLRHLGIVSVLMAPGWLAMANCSDQQPKLTESNWDLSKSNDVSAVDWPADMKSKDGIASLGGPRKLSLRLANGKTISAIVEEIYAENRGKRIWWIALCYPKTTLKDSVAVAKDLMSLFDYKSTRIDDWFDKRSNDGSPGPTFEENFPGKKPSLSINILHSFDKSKPWWTKATIFLE